MSATTARGGRVPEQLQGVIRSLGWLLASRGVLAILSLFYLAIITRTLGVTGFGRFVLITGAAQALTTLISFQTWQIIVQYGTAPVRTGDESALGRLYRGCARLDAASAVVGMALSAAILSVWGEALGIGPTLQRATLILTVIQLISIRSTPLGILRLRDRFSLAALAESATPVVRLSGAAAVALIHPTLQGFLVAWMAAELLTAGAYWVTVWRLGELKLLRRGHGGVASLIRENKGIVRFALTTNVNATLSMSSKQIPLLLVGATAGVAAAGAYRLAAQLAQALAKFSQLLARAAFPEIVRAVDAEGVARVGRFLGRSVIYSALVGVVIFGLLALAGKPFLTLIGNKEFAFAYPILLWLAAAGCIDLITVGFEPLLVAAGRTGTTFMIRLTATIALFVVALAFAPQLGAIGIAVAVVIHALLVAAMLGFTVARMVRKAPAR